MESAAYADSLANVRRGFRVAGQSLSGELNALVAVGGLLQRIENDIFSFTQFHRMLTGDGRALLKTILSAATPTTFRDRSKTASKPTSARTWPSSIGTHS